jgi:hypothetical protein
MASDLTTDKDYRAWLTEIKLRIRTVQLKAAVSVNSELLRFYWGLGADIAAKQITAKWGDGLLPQLSRDLMAEFHEMKGFSLSNLEYIRQWYLFYARSTAIGQQAVGQTTKPPSLQLPQHTLGNNLLARLPPSPGDTISRSSRNAGISQRPFTMSKTR